jgi:hypothetical protein
MPKLLLAAALLLGATPSLAFSVDPASEDQPIRINPVYTVHLTDGSSDEVVQLPRSVTFHLSVVRDPIVREDLAVPPPARLDPGYDHAFEPMSEPELQGLQTPVDRHSDPELLVLTGSGVDPNVLADQLR